MTQSSPPFLCSHPRLSVSADDRTLCLALEVKVYTVKMMGESTVPCGAPELLTALLDVQPLSFTNYGLFVCLVIIAICDFGVFLGLCSEMLNFSICLGWFAIVQYFFDSTVLCD